MSVISYFSYRVWKKFAGTIVLAFVLFSACQMVEPEVVVINKISPRILVRNPSFNGVVWNTILSYGEATSPRQCLRGEGRVHFQKFDAYTYCRHQAEYGLIDSICMCDTSWLSNDTDVISQTPLWYNYQTIAATDAVYGSFHVIELKLDDMEQDFSVPGPYGH
jgi:hypothetical protein